MSIGAPELLVNIIKMSINCSRAYLHKGRYFFVRKSPDKATENLFLLRSELEIFNALNRKTVPEKGDDMTTGKSHHPHSDSAIRDMLQVRWTNHQPFHEIFHRYFLLKKKLFREMIQPVITFAVDKYNRFFAKGFLRRFQASLYLQYYFLFHARHLSVIQNAYINSK